MRDTPYEGKPDRSPPEASGGMRDLPDAPEAVGMEDRTTATAVPPEASSAAPLGGMAALLGQDLSARFQRLLQETEAEGGRVPYDAGASPAVEAVPAGTAGTAEAAQAPEATQTSGAAVSAGAPGGILSWLMAHPELLKILPTMLQTLGPLLRTLTAGNAASSAAAPAGATSAVMAETSMPTAGTTAASAATPVSVRPAAPIHPAHPDRHIPLLKALRPYLAPERQQAMDTVITLCQVWDTLQGLGISLFPLIAPTDASATAGMTATAATVDSTGKGEV